ncbi:zinc ion binding [Raphanus sativus]|nr:zinc ion binding [Raphanus sativus]
MVKSHRGFPTHCPCGSRVSFRTSKTIANPGRLFHSCPYGNEEALGHAKDLEVLQTEVQNLIQKNMAHATTIQRCHHDVEETKDQLEGLKTDLKCLKNLLLCTLFLGFVYKFIL